MAPDPRGVGGSPGVTHLAPKVAQLLSHRIGIGERVREFQLAGMQPGVQCRNQDALCNVPSLTALRGYFGANEMPLNLTL